MVKGYTIKEFCKEDRPREKLKKYGAFSLSDKEVLAILLRTGTKNKNVIELASSILEDVGGITKLRETTFNELAKHKGIGEEKAIHILEEYQVPFEVRVLSAHRCPNEAREFAASARESGFSVLIAAAGMAAHLAGALAANTTLPVIGIPCSGANFDGMDALLSTVQMPGGIPVATVAVNGSKNAALLAIEILAVTDETLAAKLAESRRRETEAVLQADADMRRRFHADA